MKKKKTLKILFLVSMPFLGAFIYIILVKEKPPEPGLIRVKSYRYIESDKAACQAFMPECGVCFGKVINKECWVDPAKLSESEKSISGIR